MIEGKIRMNTNQWAPTAALYGDLQKAFDHFNEELFESKLPPVMITLNRKRNARGYFHPEQFVHRTDGDKTHEIAITPDTMDRPIKDVLSTLVHEMTHLQQEEFGKPSKTGHNKEWGSMMDAIGLEPTSTGLPGGKRTGRKVTHMIVPGGPFDVSADKLMVDLAYFALPKMVPVKRKKDLSKLVSCCPECRAKAWSKQGALLICANCEISMKQEEVEKDD